MSSLYLDRVPRTIKKALFDKMREALIASTRNLRFAQMSVPNARERELLGERIEANMEIIEAAEEASDG